MSRFDTLLWLVIPYVCFTTFVIGHIWRYRKDQFTWTTRSTQLLESKLLRIGGVCFHLGMLAVIGGHVLGILVPKTVTETVGVNEHLYHIVSVAGGTSSGLLMTIGFCILFYRRLKVPRIRQSSTKMDRLIYLLLFSAILTGMWATVGVNLLGGGYDYRESVAPWFRGFFLLQPKPKIMLDAPLVYQIHALTTVLLLAVWPFSRLVHAWSVPVTYLRRSPILYRRRDAAANPRVVQH